MFPKCFRSRPTRSTPSQQAAEEEETGLPVLLLSKDLHNAGADVRSRKPIPPTRGRTRLALRSGPETLFPEAARGETENDGVGDSENILRILFRQCDLHLRRSRQQVTLRIDFESLDRV